MVSTSSLIPFTALSTTTIAPVTTAMTTMLMMVIRLTALCLLTPCRTRGEQIAACEKEGEVHGAFRELPIPFATLGPVFMAPIRCSLPRLYDQARPGRMRHPALAMFSAKAMG